MQALKNGITICRYDEFPLEKLDEVQVLDRKITKKHKTMFLNILTAFDIETTRIKSIEQAVMYVWQWHFAEPINLTVVGRTWLEFELFRDSILHQINKPRPDKGEYEKSLCVYVHNLAYEFQFLRGIYSFGDDEVFAVERRKPLYCTMCNEQFVFRCSYLHSNMSLNAYTHKMGAKHGKLSGIDFDYNKTRYPWTELSEQELEYCVNDVVGLCEALQIEMTHDGDNLYTIPLTSTGYVRRDARAAMEKSGKRPTKCLPDKDLYTILREAFRGGNTHANRYFVGQKITGTIHSADRSSSYPDVLCNCKFPVTEFKPIGAVSLETLKKKLNQRQKAMIMRIALENVELIDPLWGAPYLTKDKSRNVIDGEFDNGRILSATYLETTITDVDLAIILSEYKFTNFTAFDCWQSTYSKLPKELIECTIGYYKAKTELKNVDGQELYYMKSKNKLNSIYGMMAQDPGKRDVLYLDGAFEIDNDKPLEKVLQERQRNAFLCYQWGVWTTAWARFRLEEGIRLAGVGFVYCDTDSVKYIGDIDWTAYNKQRIKDSKQTGARAKDPKGKWHYMGVYEPEHDMCEFATLGAKKYVYRETPESPLQCTIAGVNKKAGARELEEHGGIDAFKPDFVFVKAGGTESVYNDNPPIGSIVIDGHTLPISSNVVIRESTYTLGITAEYDRLLNTLDVKHERNRDYKKYFANLLTDD